MKTSDPKLGTTLEDSLELSLKDLKMEDLFHASKILKHWEVIVGEKLSRHCMPGILKKGVLQVLVPDGMYKKHLQLHANIMLDLIRSEGICPPNKVFKIKFVIDSHERIAKFLAKKFHPQLERAGLIQPNNLKKIKLDQASKMAAEEASANIQNPDIRKAFERMMARKLSQHHKDEQDQEDNT